MTQGHQMEIPASSPALGTVKALLVAVDEMVEEAQALVIIET
jgi:biotin carboxyl carrier protein